MANVNAGNNQSGETPDEITTRLKEQLRVGSDDHILEEFEDYLDINFG